jgi:uncharacterized membrane protein
LTGRAGVARALDLVALLLAAAIVAALVLPFARPEDLFIALVLVAGLRHLLRPWAIPAFEPRAVVAGATVAYALGFSFVTVTRHVNLQTHALDLGYYVQVVWSMATGRGPRVSLPEMHAWGDHLSPILWAIVPAFWLAPGPITLLVLQSIALALGAPAVYLLARRRLGDPRLATLFALLYLTNPSLHGMNVRDFHAAALAVPLLLWAFVAAEAGRALLFAGTLVLVLATREDAALAVMGVGLWLGLARRQWLAGAATAVGAFAVLWADVRWVIPGFRGESYSHLGRYEAFGRSLPEIALGILRHPLAVLARVATPDRLVYLLAMLVPLGFLSLVAPAELAGALPGLVQNLLSRDPVLFHHRTQYQSFVLPFLILAAIAGAARLRDRRPDALARGAMVLAVLASLVLSSRTVNQLAVYRWWPDASTRAAHRVLARVPATAAVSAQDPYVPHLSLRPLVFVFPNGIEKCDHVLLNVSSYPWRNLPGVTMRRDGDEVAVTAGQGGTVYRYTVAAEGGPHLLLRGR